MTNTDESTIFNSIDKIVEAFADFDLEGLLKSTDRDYYLISEAVRKAGEEAKARGDIHLEAGLHLVWAVCSYHGRPENDAEPFGPMIELGDRHSPIPDDLTEVQVTTLAQLTSLIKDPFVRGRIADVVWLEGKPRNHKCALRAIEDYIATDVESSSWLGEIEDNWRRAASLGMMLGSAASSLVSKIESTLLSAFTSTHAEDRYFGARLASLLRNHGLARQEARTIAGKLADLASQFHHIGDYYASADHFAAAAKWCAIGDDERQQMVMTALRGRAMVRAVEARIQQGDGGYLVATVDVEKAIQVFRQVPGKYRAELGVDHLAHRP